MSRVTAEDLGILEKRKNPPKNEPGFEDEGIDDILKECNSSGKFDDLSFDDWDSLDGYFDDGDDITESSGDKRGSKGKISFDEANKQLDADASSAANSGGYERSKSDELSDAVIVACSQGVKYIWESVKLTFKNVKTKDGNDIGRLAKNTFITSGIAAITALVAGTIRLFTGLKFIGRFGMRMFVPSIALFGLGLIEFAVSGYLLVDNSEDTEESKEIKESVNELVDDIYEDDDVSDILEDDEDDIMDMLDDDDLWEDTDTSDPTPASSSSSSEKQNNTQSSEDSLSEIMSLIEQSENEKINSDETYASKFEHVSNIHAKVDREYLFNTFKGFFKRNCEEFGKVKELDSSSSDYKDIEAMTLKAMAAANNKTYEEVKTDVVSISETSSSYIISVKRILGLNNVEEIRREVETYFMSDTDEHPITVSVKLDGDNYKIIVSKKKTNVVTFGDTLSLSEVSEYIKDEKHVFPYVIGVNEIGNPVYRDAKHYSSMLIAGLPRSGKTWCVVNLMTQLMAFNTPEDVQFVLIDPKKSSLFRTLALMPHVAGLHSDNVNMVLGGIVKSECERRANLLQQAKCDDIWELRNRKKMKLPVLYIVIDEYISICDGFKDSNDKEGRAQFDSYISTIVTQMPSKGVRLIIIAHRAQNYVEKTVRNNMSFICAVNALDEVVKDTLGVKNFNRHLFNIGDSAIQAIGDSAPFYAKGIGITTSDEENRELITYMAKSYYKMGVTIPTTRYLGYAANRNEDQIRRELEEYDKPLEIEDDTELDIENERQKTLDEIMRQSQKDF